MKGNNKLDVWLDSLCEESMPSIDDCVNMLGDKLQWLHMLKDTPQDPEWHAEGNVHIHTGMVLDALYCLLQNEAAHITGRKRQALILGTLLHDIGKPMRTKEVEIRGRIRVASPQHEAVGRSYLAFKLLELDLPFDVVWTVLHLVGEHHMPKLLVVKNRSAGDYHALARVVELELLYWLEVADMTGRTCLDKEAQLTILEEFKMFSEEYDLWQKNAKVSKEINLLIDNEPKRAQAYIHGHGLWWYEQNLISTIEEAPAKAFEHKSKHSHLVVLCGPSGSGKSTWIKKYCKDYELVSLDEIRKEINGCLMNQKNKGQVVHRAKDLLKACLRTQTDVVWDATNLRSEFRKIICDIGRDYHALITLVVFLLPENEIYRGNANREYAVPEDILAKQIETYQFPTLDEAHQFLVVGSKGEQLHQSGFLHADDAEFSHSENGHGTT